MASEQMQAFIDALRERISQDESFTVQQHRTTPEAEAAIARRRPPHSPPGNLGAGP